MEKPVWKASAQGPVSTECSDVAAESGDFSQVQLWDAREAGVNFQVPSAPAVTDNAVNACHRSDELNWFLSVCTHLL